MNKLNKHLEHLSHSLLEKWKSYPYLATSAVLFVVLIAIPFLIWLSYYIGENHACLIHTSLSAGDALGFYGTLLSFAGTTALGAIAVWQNKRLQKLEADASTKDSSCNIYLRKYDYGKDSAPLKRLSHDGRTPFPTSKIRMSFKILNCSEAFLTEIEIDFNGAVFHSNITLIKGEEKYFYLFLPQDYDVQRTRHRVTFTSCYGVKTFGDIVIRIHDGQNRADIKYYHFSGTTLCGSGQNRPPQEKC